ncbi:MAG: Monosaccharide-transporting ATPase, partial [Conexibacter sp.]|nr:Monosaccharide-transporting ATPase [Conexibacter sp.]
AVGAVPAPVRGAGEAPPVLRAEGIGVRIGGLQILEDVSLELVPGQVTALLGANGAGKSTLINVLSGFMRPTVGSVAFGDAELVGSTPASICAKGLVRTFQHPRLVLQQTVFDNALAGLHRTLRPGLLVAALPPLTRGVRAQQRAQVMATLERLGIAALAEAKVADLSGGHRQLVSIARALLTSPTALLLDEPVAGLSPDEANQVADAIGRVAESGVAVLLVEHRLDVVREVAWDAVCLDSGRVLSVGEVDVVLADPAVREAFLGTPASDPPAPHPTTRGATA